jgi:HEAT repeat protein
MNRNKVIAKILFLIAVMLLFIASFQVFANYNDSQLLAMLQCKDAVKRANAAHQIALTGAYPKGGIEALISCLGDFTRLIPSDKIPVLPPPQFARDQNETSPSEEAVKALVRIGKPAVPLLIKSLSKDDLWATEEASRCLGLIRDKRALPALIKLLEQGREGDIVEAVALIGRNEVYDPLLNALKHSELNTYKSQFGRYDTIYALGYSGDPRFLQLLLDFTKHEDPGVKEASIYALGYLKNLGAIPRLIELLKDPEPYIRRSVCEALGDIGDPKSKKYLEEHLRTETDSFVIWAAESALKKIGRSKK